MRWATLLSLIVVVLSLILTSFILYVFAPGDPQRFLDLESDNGALVMNDSTNLSNDAFLFYPNIRFKDRKISYFIDKSCDESKTHDARLAFNLLENETILNFEEKLNGEIKVSCSEEESVPQEGFFVAGEGGPNSIINASNFYVINNGTILLYRDNKCKTPIVGIHEILHVLGFKHSLNKKSIMYEISSCNQRLSSEVVDVINEVYTYPKLPDLTIRDATATKTGRKLEFKVEIFNAGLDFSLDAKIGIFADGELINEYDLGELEIGSGKIITVSNLRIPGDVEEISFKVDSENKIFEINEENNDKVLIISSQDD